MPSTKAEMTLPKALRDRLIFVALKNIFLFFKITSFNLAPSAYVLLYLSEPAKSTKLSFPTQNLASPSIFSSHSIKIVNIECDLEDSAFIKVEPTERFSLPLSIHLFISAAVFTISYFKSLIKTPLSGCSFTSNAFLGS